jgi:hypothetical protein
MTTVAASANQARGYSWAPADSRRERNGRANASTASGAALTGPNGAHMRHTRLAATASRLGGCQHGLSQAPAIAAVPPVGSRTAGASTKRAHSVLAGGRQSHQGEADELRHEV